MIHIYCGDGKGKTTCAFGLALRAAGRGRKVVIAQFLKSGDSGERDAIARVPGVTLLPAPEQVKFTFQMNEEEKAACAVQLKSTLERVSQLAKAGDCGLVVLDECCAAVSTGCCLWRMCSPSWTAHRRTWRWSSPAGTRTPPWWNGPTTSPR